MKASEICKLSKKVYKQKLKEAENYEYNEVIKAIKEAATSDYGPSTSVEFFKMLGLTSRDPVITLANRILGKNPKEETFKKAKDFLESRRLLLTLGDLSEKTIKKLKANGYKVSFRKIEEAVTLRYVSEWTEEEERHKFKFLPFRTKKVLKSKYVDHVMYFENEITVIKWCCKKVGYNKI